MGKVLDRGQNTTYKLTDTSRLWQAFGGHMRRIHGGRHLSTWLRGSFLSDIALVLNKHVCMVDKLLELPRGMPWESPWVISAPFPPFSSHTIRFSRREHTHCPFLLAGEPYTQPPQAQRAPTLSPHCGSLFFSGLQAVNGGLRPPVRAIKTSWQGGELFIC